MDIFVFTRLLCKNPLHTYLITVEYEILKVRKERKVIRKNRNPCNISAKLVFQSLKPVLYGDKENDLNTIYSKPTIVFVSSNFGPKFK